MTAGCVGHALYTPLLPSLIKWLRCADCAHVFTDGYWSPEALAAMFKKTHDYQTLGDMTENARSVSAAIIDKITPYADRGKWLDVGFGNGALLFTAKEYGFDPVGLELRPGAAAALTERGVPGHATDICDFADAGGFSVVSFADVLEHLPFPKKAIKAARRLLRPGGVLFVSAPNMGAPIWDFYDTRPEGNPYWFEIEHYHNFTRGRLCELLREHGFEPVRYGVSGRYIAGMEIIATAT